MAARKNSVAPKPVAKCLNPLCESIGSKAKVHCMGQCQKCYNQSRNLVKSGHTTWPKLIKLGYAKKGRMGRPGGTMYDLIVGTK
jgi:hypothetical protein